MIYVQNYNPLGSALISTIVAALPVLVLFFLLVIVRVKVPWAAAGGALTAFVIAVLVYHMPVQMAGLAFWDGSLYALLPICWTIVNAMLLYNLTVVTGRFENIKLSVAGLSADHRLQAVLIAFAFGAFLEGAAGAGTPVAICAAMMVGLGFRPFLAACLCLIANTSPVAYGGFGTPIFALEASSGLSAQHLSHVAGNQLPLLSCIIPFWLVRCMCTWRQTFEVLPAIAVAGGSFALSQFLFAHSPSFPLTDIAGGLISLVITAVFLRFWRPKTIFRLPQTDDKGVELENQRPLGLQKHISIHQTLQAWLPFTILCVLMVCIGSYKKPLEATHFGPIQTVYKIHIGGLDKKVRRNPPVVEKPTLEDAVFNCNWFTSPGTSILFANILTVFLLRVRRSQFRAAAAQTWKQLALPVPTIVCMIGLSYLTRYGGLDATLGMAFKNAGGLYPFFAAMLGWLGVFLTGTDAGSNALFGSLQKITALQLGLNPYLICAANSTGGVMGKMIDAQSICVATAATDQVGKEASIFKFVVWHSIALAAIVGLICLLQAYVPPFTHMVPPWKP